MTSSTSWRWGRLWMLARRLARMPPVCIVVASEHLRAHRDAALGFTLDEAVRGIDEREGE